VADGKLVAHRYNAACEAALAAGGVGAEAKGLEEKDKARWRKQALEWLRADLAALEKAPAAVRQRALLRWLADRDFTAVREREALAGLPDEERRAWAAFWASVRALASP
jgi:hypothetical protein